MTSTGLPLTGLDTCCACVCYPWQSTLSNESCCQLCVLQIVAGALVEGDEADEDAGNAGSWIKVELMLEEVNW